MTKHTGAFAPLPIIGYRKNGCPIYPIAGADGTRAGNPVLDRLRSQRQEQVDFIDQALAKVEGEDRDLVDAEKRNLETCRDRIKEIDEQLKPLEEFEELRTASSSTTQRYSAPAAGNDDQRRGLGAQTELRGHEYKTRGEVVVDLLRAAPHGRGGSEDRAARERLMGARVPFESAPEDYQRTLANEITSDVPGLIPKPIVGAVDNDLDASRPFVQSIGAKDLGSIPGKVFTRPTVTQHTTVGKQTTEKTELPSQKFTVGGVDFTKETYGGALDVSRQTIDWTSPAAWDALLSDLQDEYGIETEDVAADAFNTAVTQAYDLTVADADDVTIKEWIKGIYGAAAQSYAGVKRLPDHIWMSLDMWATIGAAVDQLKATTNGNGGGNSSASNFAGNMLNVDRTVVPAFTDGTVIVGVKSKTEFYEQRIGLLTAVEPRLLGVEIAYGGYVAYGTLRPAAFSKITPAEAGA